MPPSMAGAWNEGWLERAPASWLHLLVKSSDRVRLPLFRTCKGLARIVLQSAPNITLHLVKPPPAHALEQRRKTITQLLDADCNFTVIIHSKGSMPIPYSLSDNFTVLQILCWSAEATNIDWALMPGLKSVEWQHYASKHDLRKLCDAVEAGHLPQLSRLRCCSEKNEWSDGELQRYIAILGPRLHHLETNNPGLLSYMSKVSSIMDPQLQSVSILCGVTAELIQQLCSHPTLQSVRLCGAVQGDASGHACKWQELCIHGMAVAPKSLPFLPLSGLRQLQIEYSICISDEVDQQALRHVLAQQALHVSCTPTASRSVFKLMGLCTESLAFVQHIMGAKELQIHGQVQQPVLLQDLWSVWPTSATTVSLRGVTGVDWLLLWKGLPSGVSHVHLAQCQVSADLLKSLLAAAPTHVKSMVVSDSHKLYKSWEDAGLQSQAPAYVQLTLVDT